MSLTIHASTVAIGEAGVLIRGAPGAGKTTLALALVGAAAAAGRFARLLADDATLLEAAGGRLLGRAPATIAGLAEVRGHGIVAVPHIPAIRIVLVVDLVDRAHLVRMPTPATCTILGVTLPAAAAETCNTLAATFTIGALLPGVRLTPPFSAAQRRPSVGASALGSDARDVCAGDGS